MSVKVALNGFGRIGRIVTRIVAEKWDENSGIELVAVNARANVDTLPIY